MEPEDTVDEIDKQDQPKTIGIKEFEELKTQFEHVKNAQAGSDKKVAELQAMLAKKDEEIENVKRAKDDEKLTDIQRLTKQIEDMQKTLTEKERQAAKVEFLNKGYKLATERGLPTSLIDNYGGNPEGLEGFLDSQKQLIEEMVNKGVEERFGKSGHTPKGGAADKPEHDWRSSDKEENIKAFGEMFSQYLD